MNIDMLINVNIFLYHNLLDVFNKFKGVGGGKASPHSPGANSFKAV